MSDLQAAIAHLDTWGINSVESRQHWESVKAALKAAEWSAKHNWDGWHQEIARSEARTPAASPVEGEAAEVDRMVQIDTLIADLKKISEQWGNTCVYVRRGGLSWGAVALNYRADDEKHGVFDLQAQHDRDMLARCEQVERLIASVTEQRLRAETAEARIKELENALAGRH